MSSAGPRTVTFDDRDTVHIKYSDGWTALGNTPPDLPPSNDSTFHFSNDLTVTFGFTFPEPAVSFTYWGFHRCCGGFYQICIDCDPSKPNWQDIDAVEPTDNGTLPAVALFSQTFDTAKARAVIVRNQPDSRFNNVSQITIDRLDIVVDPNAPTSTSASTASDSSTAAGDGSKNTANPNTAKTSQSNSTPVGAIVGGVVGSIVVLVAAVLFFLWLRRRNKNSQPIFRAGPATILPYDAPSAHHPSMAAAPGAALAGGHLYQPQAGQPFIQSGNLASHQATAGGGSFSLNGAGALYAVNGSASNVTTTGVGTHGPPSESAYTTSTTPSQPSGKRALITANQPQSPSDSATVATMGPSSPSSRGGEHNRTGSAGAVPVRQEVDAGPMSATGMSVLPPGYHQVFGSER